MRKRQQSQNEGTSAVSQAPGNQRANNTCCFCWCCCCSCSCLTVRNEDRGDSTGRPTHTSKLESIQVIEEYLLQKQCLDSRVREVINRNLLDPNCHMYEDAQLQIYTLMHRDSFPRFLNSQIYKSLLESTRSSTSET
uniref:Regulator of G protein signaling 17 n=1 Tax=Naja naja TaxID=35670 RepID=A0A8C6V4L7_NAJNA